MSNILITEMLARRDDAQTAVLSRFFRTAPGQYGEGDRFLGIKVPVTRSVVKLCSDSVSPEELEECISSPFHELRLAALLTLVRRFKKGEKKQSIDFYLAHLPFVNNWDLVDLSCYELLGNWLLDKERTLLYELARSGKTLWEKRIGIVSTMQFIRHNELADTFAIAEILLPHPHDLIHKATGWLLREAGKRDAELLRRFLAAHKTEMPRTALRYAIERFDPEERKYWLK